jgi:hypothetical protein
MAVDKHINFLNSFTNSLFSTVVNLDMIISTLTTKVYRYYFFYFVPITQSV